MICFTDLILDTTVYSYDRGMRESKKIVLRVRLGSSVLFRRQCTQNGESLSLLRAEKQEKTYLSLGIHTIDKFKDDLQVLRWSWGYEVTYYHVIGNAPDLDGSD